MTKKQRAEVVEVLRCAYDVNMGVGEFADVEGIEDPVGFWAWLAIGHVVRRCPQWNEGYRLLCLEAAALVEEGHVHS